MSSNNISTLSTPSIFSTPNLHLASWLYCLPETGFSGLKNGNGIAKYFCFDNKPLCEELESQYWQKRGEVAPKVYSDSLRTLRSLIFNGASKI